MPKPRDAIVVGAGPNGLVTANLLADAGWDVLLLEAQPEVGGAVKSARDVADGFVHDTFSSFYPMAAVSPAIRSLRLEEQGLRWRHAPAVLGHPRPDGGWAMLHREVEQTAVGLDTAHPGDGDAWRALSSEWEQVGPAVLQALLTPFPPVRGGLRVLGTLPSVGGLQYVRTLLEPVLSLGAHRFGGEDPTLLLAGNAMHSDIPLSAPGSGVLALILTMVGQQQGFPVPEGGAGQLAAALARRFLSRGGEIRCGVRVDEVLVENRRALGVRTAHGERLMARGVVADVAAQALYGQLVPWTALPKRTRTAMSRFEIDPGTIKVDWALDGPIPWTSPPPADPGTVHLSDSVDQLAAAQSALTEHLVPADPFLLVGQMTTTDPTRSPAGTEALWAYTHVPQRVRDDQGPDGLTGRWDHDENERMADRMQARIEAYAPDFASRILARRILGPHELQARNANLVMGALGGGTASLHQQLVLRPVPGLGRAETPIRGLFLGSASAHPGGAVHGAPGANAARALLAAARFGRI
ncbi:MAG TPA: NAD(P)/FAD-dependent oxidoreductase [Propionibacteriaceae bacterium]